MKKGAKKPSRTSAAKAVPTNSWMIHDKAIKELERGVNHLHKQQYSEALSNFKSIVDEYPEEKELKDRAKVYVRICETRLERKTGIPNDPQDLFYLGVFKANEAAYDEAVGYLERALQSSPKDEKIHYVLASTLALKGERGGAGQKLPSIDDLRHSLNSSHQGDLRRQIVVDDGIQLVLHLVEPHHLLGCQDLVELLDILGLDIKARLLDLEELIKQ